MNQAIQIIASVILLAILINELVLWSVYGWYADRKKCSEILEQLERDVVEGKVAINPYNENIISGESYYISKLGFAPFGGWCFDDFKSPKQIPNYRKLHQRIEQLQKELPTWKY